MTANNSQKPVSINTGINIWILFTRYDGYAPKDGYFLHAYAVKPKYNIKFYPVNIDEFVITQTLYCERGV
jgi:hypothetical protein